MVPGHVRYASDETNPAAVLLLRTGRGWLGEAGEVREDGRAGGVTAHHGISRVHGTRPCQGVELDGQDVGVRTSGLPPTSPAHRGTGW